MEVDFFVLVKRRHFNIVPGATDQNLATREQVPTKEAIRTDFVFRMGIVRNSLIVYKPIFSGLFSALFAIK